MIDSVACLLEKHGENSFRFISMRFTFSPVLGCVQTEGLYVESMHKMKTKIPGLFYSGTFHSSAIRHIFQAFSLNSQNTIKTNDNHL